MNCMVHELQKIIDKWTLGLIETDDVNSHA